ncbi:hypothetical protein Psal071_00714 [Piscirickettsia salmonis]|uniref:Uncharacterized protein n=1 Tax=Piscirickettsia salmonis TaxID=1238 RepID=A0A9Q6LJ52_PISSA|nr:hypothetical protein KW89_684 [Piscirickettsia salmonis]QGN76524.1 hypothetical protein Psal001_00707 [Piscirickettsia salmonis]QGN80114.1 hypothetical protein Psal002_00732 [Piscirickettsia salmonis]QGN85613.1 hypothetical protein Psal003_02699 [Piscirickettsia salmonis]QGN89119.1 hypothetical protein Psal004_02691 [Piscirickettsia salmonis]
MSRPESLLIQDIDKIKNKRSLSSNSSSYTDTTIFAYTLSDYSYYLSLKSGRKIKPNADTCPCVIL